MRRRSSPRRFVSLSLLLMVFVAVLPLYGGSLPVQAATGDVLGVSPSQAGATQPVNLSGCGFAANATVTVSLENPTTLTQVGASSTTVAQSTGCLVSPTNQFPVPLVPDGDYYVVATSTSQTLYGIMTVGAGPGLLSLALSSVPGGVNTPVGVSGCGYTPSDSISFTIRPTASPGVPVGSAEVLAGSGSCFTNLSYMVASTVPGGSYFLQAQGTSSGGVDLGVITVTAPPVTTSSSATTGTAAVTSAGLGSAAVFSPNPANVGSTVTGTACNLSPSDTLTLIFTPGGLQITVFNTALVPAPATGPNCFSFSFIAPAGLLGTYSVTVLGSFTGANDTGTLTVGQCGNVGGCCVTGVNCCVNNFNNCCVNTVNCCVNNFNNCCINSATCWVRTKSCCVTGENCCSTGGTCCISGVNCCAGGANCCVGGVSCCVGGVTCCGGAGGASCCSLDPSECCAFSATGCCRDGDTDNVNACCPDNDVVNNVNVCCVNNVNPCCVNNVNVCCVNNVNQCCVNNVNGCCVNNVNGCCVNNVNECCENNVVVC